MMDRFFIVDFSRKIFVEYWKVMKIKLHTQEFYSAKEKLNSKICSRMDQNGKYYTEWGNNDPIKANSHIHSYILP